MKSRHLSTVFDRFQGQKGAWPYDSYNHADPSWKIPGNTTTVILNFVDSAVKIRLRTTAP